MPGIGPSYREAQSLDPIPPEIRQHAEDLLSRASDELNRLERSEMQALQATIARRKNSAGLYPGIAELQDRKLKRFIDEYIRFWMDAYSFAGRLPGEAEEERILNQLADVAEVIVSTGISVIDRRRRITSDRSGSAEAAISCLRRQKDVAVACTPRELRLALRGLESQLKSRGAQPEREAATPSQNTFRKRGDAWEVSFGGKSTVLKDSIGMRHIATLLRSQGRSLSAFELRREIPGVGSGDEGKALFQEGLSIRTPLDAGDVIDDAARAAYAARLKEIDLEQQEAMEFGHSDRVERLKEERASIAAEIRLSSGLGGRVRKIDPQGEKVRQAVYVAIRRAEDAIREALPDLATHLRTFLRKGIECSYLPDTAVDWLL